MFVEKLSDTEIMDICTKLIKATGGKKQNILNYFQHTARIQRPPYAAGESIIIKNNLDTHCYLWDYRVHIGFSYGDRFGLNDENAFNDTFDYCVTPQLASEIEQHVTTIAKMKEYKMIIYNLIVQIVVKIMKMQPKK